MNGWNVYTEGGIFIPIGVLKYKRLVRRSSFTGTTGYALRLPSCLPNVMIMGKTLHA